MWPFSKKRKRKGPVLQVDIHSHLIPGIDDGAQSLEESLLLIEGLAALGYQKIITTPHIMSDAYRNSAENILSGLDLLREEVARKDLPIRIDAAAEYYLDDKFYEELEKPHVMSISDTYLLFESSYYAKPLQMEDMIFAIGKAGFQPLLAHPERYRYVKDPEKEYKRLKDLGVMFQVNLNSFGGYYGKSAKAKATFLAEAGMIDFLGSDIHHKKQVESLEEIFSLDIYHEIFKRNQIKNNDLL
jgi:tyrosine-protein phosphatase YwqE